MEFIRATLFESPLLIYMGLALAAMVTLAIWHQTRAPRARTMLGVWVALAGAVALTAALVQTDRERVLASWGGIEAAVAESDVEGVMAGISDGFSTEGIDKAAFRKLVTAGRRLMGGSGVSFRGFTVEGIEKGRAEATVTAVFWPTQSVTQWQLTFVGDADGRWRIRSVDCTDPYDLTLRRAMSAVSSARGLM